ncbi:MAG: hypothetical protein AAGH15_24635, partial [Myxococcota bacterium]
MEPPSHYPPAGVRPVVVAGARGSTLAQLRGALESLGPLRVAWDDASALRLCAEDPRPQLV